MLFRAAAGRLIATTDSILSNRVCSYRLVKNVSCWRFADRKVSYDRFINRSLAILDIGKLRCMCRTDVTSYYPSIRSAILEEILHSAGCDAQAVSFVVDAIDSWQASSNLLGLPIGPEASAVAGNLFLNDVDKAIEAAGISHLRYGDDILAFCENSAICDAVVPLLDSELSVLGLSRSEQKTKKFYDPNDAAADLRDGWLASLGSYLRFDPGQGLHALRRAFDSKVRGQEVRPNVFRWIMTALKNKSDSYACQTLASDPQLMNVDPKISGEYLVLARSDSRVVEACMDTLSRPPEPVFQGLSLHLLKTLSKAALGTEEGEAFEKIASDGNRLWPVKAWAWTAHATSSARRDGRLMEAARAESDPNVRRAIVATLKGSQKGRRHRTFLQHAKRHFPESRLTAEWLNVA